MRRCWFGSWNLIARREVDYFNLLDDHLVADSGSDKRVTLLMEAEVLERRMCEGTHTGKNKQNSRRAHFDDEGEGFSKWQESVGASRYALLPPTKSAAMEVSLKVQGRNSILRGL